MKQLISSLLFMMIISLSAHSQSNPSPLPCISTYYVVNNAGDGTIAVTFSSPLPTPQSAPKIISITNTALGVLLNGTFTWQANVTGKTSTNTIAYYTYVASSNHQKLNNGNGSEATYSVNIQYTGYDAQTCNAVILPPPTGLPVKFVSLTATPLGSNKVQIDFEIAESTNTDHFEVQFSKDGITWYNVVVPLDHAKPNKLYSVQVPLNLLITKK